MAVLNERKQKILHAVVTDYIQTAEPVGSRTISRHYQIALSAATIRNEMADLEELGFLLQPHTSAGRIPSQRGYRFYVDSLMDTVQLGKQEENYLRRVFTQLKKMREINQIVQQTAKALSVITRYTSMVLAPQLKRSAFGQMQLIPMNEEQALVVLITDTGYIKNKVIDMPRALSQEELDRIVSFLNTELSGLTISSLTPSRLRKLLRDLYKQVDILDSLFAMLEECSGQQENKVFLGGTSNILDQPEFKDMERVKHLLTLFEEGEKLSVVLEGAGEGISISIGTENVINEMSDCSLITASYSLHGRPIGKIGVLGPTRMEYARVVAIVEEIVKHLNNLLCSL
ncbi:MAG: heat-inducible transcriptional repressor HrcA [Bacillota bacterium]|jgi:heat-inducible transcriptional repressor|nr:heat-inducible transcriptional repressor HrcA [Bacillota bacterium]HHU29837.1 heat-inducible transcription repressor HrcA [Bacillota bacterium]